MAKQIKPQQIITRIEQTIATQRERNYEPGWAYHQIDKLAEKKHKHLCHAYDADALASHALNIAKGQETIEDLMEVLNDNWEIYIEECETFGLPENER